MNPFNFQLPFDVKIKTFDISTSIDSDPILNCEIEPNEALAKHAGVELNLGRDATHEESEEYFVGILMKALTGDDGFSITNRTEPPAPSIIITDV